MTKPTTKLELQKIIIDEVNKNGEFADLNHIDVSGITDMSKLFTISSREFENIGVDCFDCKMYEFNGDISKWDVSNVTNMMEMFHSSEFNGDISNWDVSSVTNMREMFFHSEFNGDISKWNVSNVINMREMFGHSEFKGDISNWDVSNVTNMRGMFNYAEFNGDISKWDISNVKTIRDIFENNENIPIENRFKNLPQHLAN